MSLGVRQRMSLVKRLASRDNLYYIADAGIKQALFELAKDITLQDSLIEPWSNNPGAFKDIKVGIGKCSVYYEFINTEGEREQRFGLVDEERKININRAELPVIKRLIKQVLDYDDTKASDLAASIVDWRDSDSFLSIPIGSAEDSYYQNLKEPYDCKNYNFQVFRELLLVKGVDEQVFRKLRDFITIFGNGCVNINTASKEVLIALGIDEKIIEKIFLFRAGEDKKLDTQDDNIFDVPANIVAHLSQLVSLSVDEATSLSNLVAKGSVCTYSYNFMVKSHASIGETSLTRMVISVVNKDGQVLYWEEV